MKAALSSVLAAVLALSSSVWAAPTQEKRAPIGLDPPYSIPVATLAAGLSCDSASPNAVKNPILLVPGTGTTGPQSFDANWIPLSKSLGFTPCWVSPPPFMLDDAQNNAEYVVYAIKTLFAGSGLKRVPVLTWSQGGLATQWAFTFFPSIRARTSRLVAFAPDYKGTIEAGPLDALGVAAPSVWQQTAGSAYTTALANAGGLFEIVPTTNVYSLTDDVVQPQVTGGPLDSSYLFNAKNVRAQDTCGPAFVIDHAGSLTSQFSFVVGRSALLSTTGEAQSSQYGLSDCNPLPADQLTPQQKVADEALLAVAAANIAAGPKVQCEPDLKPYARRYAIGKVTCSGVNRG